jgi:hypothetical protein
MQRRAQISPSVQEVIGEPKINEGLFERILPVYLGALQEVDNIGRLLRRLDKSLSVNNSRLRGSKNPLGWARENSRTDSAGLLFQNGAEMPALQHGLTLLYTDVTEEEVIVEFLASKDSASLDFREQQSRWVVIAGHWEYLPCTGLSQPGIPLSSTSWSKGEQV